MVTKHCCFGECSEDSRKLKKEAGNKTLFVAFPKPNIEPAKCRRWINACKRLNFNETNIKSHTFMCSKHFVGGNGPTRLNPDPVPATQSKFPKCRQSQKRRPSDAGSALLAATITSHSADAGSALLAATITSHSADEDSEEDFFGFGDIPVINLNAGDKEVQTEPPTTSDQATSTSQDLSFNYFQKHLEDKISNLQAHITNISFSYESSRADEHKFVFYTGLRPEQFDVLWSFLGADVSNVPIWRGESNPHAKLTRHCAKFLNVKNQLFLMLVRLRTGLLLKDLSYRFGISVSYASKIVTSWLMFMYKRFKTLSIFPERETDRSKIPKTFKKFKNIRVVIDCFEVRSQRPQDYREQGNTYSDYKASATHKFLLGMHIRGGVCFLSDAFEGAISDKAIFKASGIIQSLHEGDLILADRGFNIADICNEIGCKVVIPPFLSGRQQFTREEVDLTRCVASARVHVERTIGRMKEFRLLQKCIPKTLVPMISQIGFVIAMLVNFQEPLV